MIPDDTIIFNLDGPSRNFEDHAVRLHHHLPLDAMPMLERGRHLLSVCPVCKYAWYKVGRQEYPRLTPEQLAFLGATLHVDIDSLHLLPKAFCPICSAIYLGGMFSVEEYPQCKGYRFLWESATPPRSRLMAMVCRSEGRTLDALVPLSLEPLVESTRDMCSVLAWLEASSFPETIRACPDEQSQHLTWRYHLENLVDGSEYQWRGYAWNATCPPLKGEVMITLAVADDTPALAPLISLLLSWSKMARAMRLVL